MKRSLILSRLRIEIRRKQAGYPTEKNMLHWVNLFLDEMAIVHSSQIRQWQKDLFLSKLQNRGSVSYEELLQAKSSLLFLYNRVLNHSNGFAQKDDEMDTEPGVFRITA